MIYLFLLWFHIIGFVAWMAGLLYLPRLFVYHCDVGRDSDTNKIFILMEMRLARYIMTPAMLISWIFGLSLVFLQGLWLEIWFLTKLILVLSLTFFHIKLSLWRKDFALGENKHSSKFFRRINEIPMFLMILIIFFVIFKPF